MRCGRAGATFALVMAAVAAAGCADPRDAERRAAQAEAEGRRSTRTGDRPEAMMVRFQKSQGSGFSREGWELEVLQLGSEARLHGSIRSPTEALPVVGTLSEEEWADLWLELSGMPLDGFKVEEDTTAAPEGWTKRLDVDIVLGLDRRILSRNTWRRPPRNAPWLDELEGSLRALATEHVLVREDTGVADTTREAVDRAVRDAMRDLAPSP